MSKTINKKHFKIEYREIIGWIESATDSDGSEVWHAMVNEEDCVSIVESYGDDSDNTVDITASVLLGCLKQSKVPTTYIKEICKSISCEGTFTDWNKNENDETTKIIIDKCEEYKL
jgi:hypothetical protein